ncbi:MAG: hypothetical protein LBV30_10815 [Propionibacteriaceae bacterium]|nr:hypothetical protein [Propionibacteriaceae bacterium]
MATQPLPPPPTVIAFEVLTTWFRSAIVAGLIFITSAYLYTWWPVLASGFSQQPQPMSGAILVHVWETIAPDNPWTALGVLVGVAAMPIGVFLALAVWSRNADTGPTDAANSLLRWSSFGVSVLAWNTLPALLHPETIGLCLIAVGGVSLVGASLFRFARPSKRSQQRHARQRQRLMIVDHTLRYRLNSIIEPAAPNHLTGRGSWRLLIWRVSLVGLPLLLASAWLLAMSIGLGADELGGRHLDLSDLPVCAMLIAAAAGPAIIDLLVMRGLQSKPSLIIDRSDNIVGWLIFISFNLLWLYLAITAGRALEPAHWQAWLMAGLIGVPLFSCLASLIINRPIFDYWHWRHASRLIEQLAPLPPQGG